MIMAASKTKPEFEGEVFTAKEIRERLEHYRAMLLEAKAGSQATLSVREIRGFIDNWLDEFLSLKGR